MTLPELGNLGDSDRHLSSTESIHDFDVYNGQNERVSKVVKVGIEGAKSSLHLVIKAGSCLTSRQVLVPRNYKINYKTCRVDIERWNKEDDNS